MPNVTNSFVQDPVKFITDNPVTSRSDDPRLKVGMVSMTTIDPKEVKGGDNYVRVSAPDTHGAKVNMYVLGWSKDRVAVGQLGTAAKYFYTGPMDGCTVAIDKNWSKPTVAHINIQDTLTGKTDRPRMRLQARHTMGNCTSIWDGKVNITLIESSLQALVKYNIFGVRGFWGWTFYRQAVSEQNYPYRVLEVSKISTW